MSERKYTVTVGIPAYNEAANILNILNSILRQKSTIFSVEKIIVACDGSTDGTPELVKSFAEKNPMIQVVSDEERLGKSGRMRQIIGLNQSGILVFFDADVLLDTPLTMHHLIKPFENKQVGFVGGSDIPFPGENFFQSLVVAAVDLWRYTRETYNNGDTVHNSHGAILALRKEFADEANLPTDQNGDDNFLYFRAKVLKYGFRYAPLSIVRHREPKTPHDFILQRGRFHDIKPSIVRNFGEWVEDYYAPLPWKCKLRGLFKALLNKPFMTPLALIWEMSMHKYFEWKGYGIKSHGPTWEIVPTTRKKRA